MPAKLSLLVLCAAVAAQAAFAATPSPVLVTYEQSGGFASIERGLAVRESGAVVSHGFSLKVKQLSPARMRTLRAALVDARFATLSKRYEADPPIADGFVYRVTYRGRGVQVDQGATVPVRLQRVLTQLRALTR